MKKLPPAAAAQRATGDVCYPDAMLLRGRTFHVVWWPDRRFRCFTPTQIHGWPRPSDWVQDEVKDWDDLINVWDHLHYGRYHEYGNRRARQAQRVKEKKQEYGEVWKEAFRMASDFEKATDEVKKMVDLGADEVKRWREVFPRSGESGQ